MIDKFQSTDLLRSGGVEVEGYFEAYKFMCLVLAPMYSTASLGCMVAHGARKDLNNMDLRNISIGVLVAAVVIFTLGMTARTS